MSKPTIKSKTGKNSTEPVKPVAIKVGILCTAETLALNYQSFLEKKGFEVKLYHKLELGIRGALVDQIRFLFVDLDFPDPKVGQFVIAVGKVLPLYIIPYTNGSPGKLRKIQHHLKMPFFIFSPTTPSAIYRMILRIQNEEGRAKKNADGEVIHKLAHFPSNSTDTLSIEDRQKIEEKLMMVFKSENPLGDELEGVIEAPVLDLKGTQESTPEKNFADIHIQTKESRADIHIQKEEAKDTKSLLEIGHRGQNIFGKTTEVDGVKISAFSKTTSKSNFQEAEKALIIRGTTEALQKTFVSKKTATGEASPITQVSEIFCFSVNTQRFKGYMLYAYAGQEKDHRQLLKLIREKLADFLKENGEVMPDSDSLMNLRIMEVDLEPWAIEKAEFLVKCADAEQEVAMVFIPREDVDEPLEESAKKEMLKLKIQELKADSVLECDAFIFMPTNDKYVRYHKSGNIFSQLQKDRLNKNKVSDLHIKKEAVSDVQKYRAVVFLDEKIAEYKNKLKGVAA